MEEYTETQIGWIIVFSMIPVEVLIVILYVYQIGNQPIDSFGLVIISVTLTATTLLFYAMTTRITSTQVIVFFGIGVVRKTIDLNRIMTVDVVKNPWYYGRGIRFIPNGMLWNIRGPHAVELRFNDSDRVLRIGTKDPVNLKVQIEKRLSPRRR